MLIKELDVSKWKIANVTNMEYMFSGCGGVSELDVSKWSTASVTGTEYMFAGCSGLTTLDLSNWNTGAVKDCERMFANCTKLITIYAGGAWDMSNVKEETVGYDKLCSNDMFTGCTSLVGGEGTTYNASKVNKDYARIDGGTSNPGYFTEKK
jgi:surface protein